MVLFEDPTTSSVVESLVHIAEALGPIPTSSTSLFWYNLRMRDILKQASWLVIAQFLTRIIGFFYTIFLARNLGVEDFGLFSVGLAYFSIISSFSDFGFNRYLIREISKEEGKKWELIWNLLMLRLTLICSLFAIFALILYQLDSDKIRVNIILLSSLAVLPQTIALTFDGVFIALRKLQYSAISSIISSFSTVLIGLFLISRGFAIYGAVNALILGQLIFALTFLILIYLKLGMKLTDVKLSVIKEALKGSLPYGLLGILGLLYFRIDTIMLSYLRGNFETGIYGASYRFLEAVAFIPSAFSFALFPVLAKLHERKSKIEIRHLYFKSIKIMGILGFSVTIIFLLFASEAIKLFMPDFLPAIDVIKILSLSIPLMFMASPGVQVMFSTDKYLKEVLLLSIFTLGFNILLNLAYIPKFGLFAASWITVASDLLSLIIFYIFIRKKIIK